MFTVISIISIVLLTAADRFSKYLVVRHFSTGGEEIPFLFGLFQIRYVENTGAAFSLFSDSTAVLTVFTILVSALCLFIIIFRKDVEKFIKICLVLIVSGGIGNLIDRISLGYVVDFIEPLFIDFAVFNVADSFITVGAFLLIGYEFYLLVKEKQEEKKTKAEKDD